MYYAIVNWYNEYDEEDIISHMLVPADDWNDAMSKVVKQFQWINSIKMEEISGCGNAEVVYIPENCVEAVINENNY